MYNYHCYVCVAGYDWPLNYHFVFDIFALLTLLTVFISIFLPRSIEKKREN